MSPREFFLISLVLSIVGVSSGALLGWNARAHSTKDRYIHALAEKHETQARYWEAQAHDIITNNTLERNRRDGKKKD